MTNYKKKFPPCDRLSPCRKSQEISALYLYHSQRNDKSKVQKGKFTRLGGSSVKHIKCTRLGQSRCADYLIYSYTCGVRIGADSGFHFSWVCTIHTLTLVPATEFLYLIHTGNWGGINYPQGYLSS